MLFRYPDVGDYKICSVQSMASFNELNASNGLLEKIFSMSTVFVWTLFVTMAKPESVLISELYLYMMGSTE